MTEITRFLRSAERCTWGVAASLTMVLALVPAARLHAQSSTTDPRAGLKPGLYDAGEAAKGMELVAHRNKPDIFHPNDPGGLTYANSDLAFAGQYVYQGNFSGLQIWDVSNPAAPSLTNATLCFTEQGDVSIYGNLLFVSAENTGSRLDCGTQGVQDSVSTERMLGIRIFDVSDPQHPRQVADVQTCRGSHTHTVVPDPRDSSVVYVYVSGLARVRSSSEMAGCEGGDITDPNTALFRIEVIKVPLAHPEQAAIVSSPRIFNDLTAPPSHGAAYADTANGALVEQARRRLGRMGLPSTATAADSEHVARLVATLMSNRGDSAVAAAVRDTLEQMGVTRVPFGGGGGNRRNVGPSQCHDITVYPAASLAAGACSGYGLLLDMKDPQHPTRLQAVSDSNFSFWHSATFNNDATSLLYTDEWGGGTQAKCRATDPSEWGADALFRLHDGRLTQTGYFKMPAAQTPTENCVAHNGGLVPVPGRDIMVQGWYQGGISVFDFTDPAHPKEIAYFDRGPIDSTELVIGGYWGGYYYNGYIYGSEIARGLDVFRLTPTPDLTQNEIDAAALVHFDRLNPQSQPKLVWPAAFPVARAYLDQLVRDNGLPRARTSAIASALDAAERMGASARAAALTRLAGELDRDQRSARDRTRVHALADVVQRMAAHRG
ncbi:MAG TPA: hypothetical protein VFK13_07420 [Gemmatimonadaceae bacterium]|nr:hypothetical protein [Gemmatimonadaceae bacterium]